MAKLRFNPNLAKIHRSYTIEEAANLFNVHKNTVRNWIKAGLPIIDDMRPALILGCNLREFLKERRVENKRPCEPGEIYCVRCRQPKSPVGNSVNYVPINQSKGNLIGICPCCDTKMHQITSLAKLEQIRTQLDVSMPQAEQHITESNDPSVNCDFN